MKRNAGATTTRQERLCQEGAMQERSSADRERVMLTGKEVIARNRSDGGKTVV